MLKPGPTKSNTFIFGTCKLIPPFIDGVRDACKPATVVVIGVSKGGTSTVAAILDALDICMGSSVQPGSTFEDRQFMDAGNLQPKVVEEHNEKFKLWGYKNSEGVSSSKIILPLLRNPHCVFVFRDPIAITGCHWIERQGKVDVWKTLMEENRRMTELLEHARGCKYPKLIISYERMLSHPQLVVGSLSYFLSLTPSPIKWSDAISRVSRVGGYLSFPKDKTD